MADELSDNDIFDSIVSGTPASEQQQEPAPQPRDDSGRFATQQVDKPAVIEAPVAEAQPVAEQAAPSGGNVPVGAVQAEREKRQAAQQEAEALRREVAELRGMVTATRQPAPQPQPEQQPLSIFEDPDAFLKSQLSPVQQQMQETRELILEMQATQIHGAEAMAAAKEAAKALFGTPEGQSLASKPGNLFDNLVKWHKQQQAFAKVGDDPDAWLNSEIERRLADPAEQAKILERIRAGATPSQASGGRPTPVTNLPPSLSRLPAGGNAPAGQSDQSDGALFSSVTSGRR
jgi:hypothetical protein